MDRLRVIYARVINLNLFYNETNDEYLRQNQIISTRIYIILLMIILSGFTAYTSLSRETTVIIIPVPSQFQYEQLQLEFVNNLQCPCTDITISYEDFITINPSYHQICSSSFISQQWIDYLFYENTSYYYQLDFRRSASNHFQTLRTLCQQAQQTIIDSSTKFYSTQFITIYVVTFDTFNIQTNSIIELFQVTAKASFQNVLKLIREILICNQLFSAIDVLNTLQYERLSVPYVSLYDISYYETQSKGKGFGCYCGDTLECKLPGGIYMNLTQYTYAGSNWMGIVNASTNMINATFLIPGIFAGCSSLESVMYSTSECFFNKSCLKLIFSSFPNTSISTDSFTKLNASRFALETTFEILANELFVEDWNMNKSFEKYFNVCQPSFCQYTKEQTNGILYTFTATISLYGGLRLVLTFFIPIIVKFIRKKLKTRSVETIDAVPSSGKSYTIQF